MWRDPLDELIEDLERVVPAKAPARYETLLEDMQIVVAGTLYHTKAERERDPRYQPAHERVTRHFQQLHERLSDSREPDADRENHPESRIDSRSLPLVNASTLHAQQSTALEQDIESMCICGADEDAEHTPDCPLAYESL